jgi:hypothetical protein
MRAKLIHADRQFGAAVSSKSMLNTCGALSSGRPSTLLDVQEQILATAAGKE